jgi:hypothetical protein
MVQGGNDAGTSCLTDIGKADRIIGSKPAHGLDHHRLCVQVIHFTHLSILFKKLLLLQQVLIETQLTRR